MGTFSIHYYGSCHLGDEWIFVEHSHGGYPRPLRTTLADHASTAPHTASLGKSFADYSAVISK